MLKTLLTCTGVSVTPYVIDWIEICGVVTLMAMVACRELVCSPVPLPVAVRVTTQEPEATAVIVVEPVVAFVLAVATPGQPEAALASAI